LQIVFPIVAWRTLGLSTPGVIVGSGRTSGSSVVVVVVDVTVLVVLVKVDSVAVVGRVVVVPTEPAVRQ